MGVLGLFIEKYKEKGFHFLTKPPVSFLAQQPKPAHARCTHALARPAAHVTEPSKL
jgi:hypothetical protein